MDGKNSSQFSNYENPNIAVVSTATSNSCNECFQDCTNIPVSNGNQNYTNVNNNYYIYNTFAATGGIVHNSVSMPINYGSVANVTAPNYFNHSLPASEEIITQQQVTYPPYSYYYPQYNTVDATAFGYTNTYNTIPSINYGTNFNGAINYHQETRINEVDYNLWAAYSNTNFNKIQPPVNAYRSNTNLVDVTKPSRFLSNDMNSSMKYKAGEEKYKYSGKYNVKTYSTNKYMYSEISKKEREERNQYDNHNKINQRSDNENIELELEKRREKYSDERQRRRTPETIVRKVKEISDELDTITSKSQPPKKERQGLPGYDTLSRTQKSNFTSGALKRYLDYQRFLRNSSSKTENKNLIKRLKERSSLQLNGNKHNLTEFKEKKIPSKTAEPLKKISVLKRKPKDHIEEKVPIKKKKETPVIKLNECDNRKNSNQKKDLVKDSEQKKRENKKLEKKESLKKYKTQKSIDDGTTTDTKHQQNKEENNEKDATNVDRKIFKNESSMTDTKSKCKSSVTKINDEKNEKEKSSINPKPSPKKEKQPTNTESKERGVNINKKSNNHNKRYKNIDLRNILTRKRYANQHYKDSKRIDTNNKQELNDLVVTVNQDCHKVQKAKPVTISKPKSKPTKTIKLVINIECPKSSESDLDESASECIASPQQDLSFLDDFDIDEIVESLSICKSPIHENFPSAKELSNDMRAIQAISMICDNQYAELSVAKLEERCISDGTDIITNSEVSQKTILSDDIDMQEAEDKEKEIKNLIKHNQTDAVDTSLNNKQREHYDDVYEVIDIIEGTDNTIIIDEDKEVNSEMKENSNKHPLFETFDLQPSSEQQITPPPRKNKESIIIIDDDMLNDNDEVETLNVETDFVIENSLIPEKVENSENMNKNININKLENKNSDVLEVKSASLKANDLDKQNTITDTSTNKMDSNSFDSETRDVDISKHLTEEEDKQIETLENDRKVEVIVAESPNVTDRKDFTSSCHLNSDTSLNESKDLNKPEDTIATHENKSSLVTSGIHNNNDDKKEVANVNITETQKCSESNCQTTQEVSEQNSVNIKKDISIKGNPVDHNTNSNKDGKPVTVIDASTKTEVGNNSTEENISNVKINEPTKDGIKAKKSDENTNLNPKGTITSTPQGTNDPKLSPVLYAQSKLLEKRMLTSFNKKMTITALIYQGYYSNIFKCNDVKGNTFALKVLKNGFYKIGLHKDMMLMNLQRSTVTESPFILQMIHSFNASGNWCFLTEYYPKSLAQALAENKKCFHIDLVQKLSQQLVTAVTFLTKNHIVHSDINPWHILLDSTKERMKLCGFERANYNSNLKMNPSYCLVNYRPPEVILGFQVDSTVDVWGAALVMFEMAAGIKLFPGHYNNDILFKQLCTLGPPNFNMVEQSRFRSLYFTGTRFTRVLSNKSWVFVNFLGRNNLLQRKLFASYNKDWRASRTHWQVTQDLDKIDMLYRLLEQMLVIDPRLRLPISFVGANEFIFDPSDLFISG